MTTTPTVEDLAAYRAGTLSVVRFEAVDAWLATLPASEQEQHLGDLTIPAALTPPELLAGTFIPESTTGRFTPSGTLGEGGMGVVDLVHDRVLDRHVALKRCRPRGSNESIPAHALRLRLFRREAAITARLEHPGIVPVHDVGTASAGEPAYAMKRLTGTTLAQRAPLPPAEAADIILRVADALGFAHHAGIVHRDVKPEHVWLGAAGETLLIDWGLAGAIGTALIIDTPSTSSKSTTNRGMIGTPPWCAPEVSATSPADPRMDVWALGAVLRFALTGAAPDCAHHLPRRGLGAIVAQCQALDPQQRYATGAEVAADVRRWLRDGLALADDRLWIIRLAITGRIAMQRQPVLVTTTLLAGLALSGTAFFTIRERTLHTQQAAQQANQQAMALLGAPTPDAEGLRRWRDELAPLPATPVVEHARARIAEALATDELRGLARRYAHQGPWPTEIADLTRALHEAGCNPLSPTAAATLRTHPERLLLLSVAVQLQRALLVSRNESAATTELTTALPNLIAAAAPNAAWTSIADLLTRPILRTHDLELCQCPESEAALHDQNTADVLLATYAPDQRLARLAEQRLLAAPGAFWPHITAGRAALMAENFPEVRNHALVALGADPLSMWPHLLLAYAAMAANDDSALARESSAGLEANPQHLELQALRAVALVRTGKLDEAQRLIDALNEAPHFQHHLQHRMGHPMERTVDALRAAGIHFSAAEPAAGPVVRPQ